MENTDNLSKQQAVDGKSAFAGNTEPNPEQDTVDALGNQAGIEPKAGEPVAIKETLDERDESRWELNPDSAQTLD